MSANYGGISRRLGAIMISLAFVSQSAFAAAPLDDADSTLIRRVVEQTQRAGHLRHDLDKYMSLWTADAKIIGGRSEERAAHDTTLSRKQIEATRGLRFRGAPVKGMKLAFENTKVEVRGDRATLTHQATFSANGYVEVVREVYRLRRTADGWKAYENRWWPVKMGDADHPVVYTRKTWRTLDQEVAETKQMDDPEAHFHALFAAFRFPEAFAATKLWTKRSPNNADAWAARGTAAVFSGNADDAKKSFKTALVLDPQCNVPPYARGIGKTKSK